MAYKKKSPYKKSTYKRVSKVDKKRKAKRPGWRISASGRRYKETRPNRSDLFPRLRY